MNDAILEAFNDYTPTWANQRPGHVKDQLKIHRMTRPVKNMFESLFGPAYDTDEKVAKLQPGDLLEIMFV